MCSITRHHSSSLFTCHSSHITPHTHHSSLITHHQHTHHITSHHHTSHIIASSHNTSHITHITSTHIITPPTIKSTSHRVQHTHRVHAHAVLQQLALRVQQARAIAQHARLLLTRFPLTHRHKSVGVSIQVHHETHHVLTTERRRTIVIMNNHARHNSALFLTQTRLTHHKIHILINTGVRRRQVQPLSLLIDLRHLHLHDLALHEAVRPKPAAL